jgi:hypothetical protein
MEGPMPVGLAAFMSLVGAAAVGVDLPVGPASAG